MQKVILLAGIVGLLTVPMLASRPRNPRKALKLLILYTVGFNVAYVLALRWLYPHL